MVQTVASLSLPLLADLVYEKRERSAARLFELLGTGVFLKAAYSVTLNIFRKILFAFLIICKRRIKLSFHNKSVYYSWKSELSYKNRCFFSCW